MPAWQRSCVGATTETRPILPWGPARRIVALSPGPTPAQKLSDQRGTATPTPGGKARCGPRGSGGSTPTPGSIHGTGTRAPGVVPGQCRRCCPMRRAAALWPIGDSWWRCRWHRGRPVAGQPAAPRGSPHHRPRGAPRPQAPGHDPAATNVGLPSTTTRRRVTPKPGPRRAGDPQPARSTPHRIPPAGVPGAARPARPGPRRARRVLQP